MKRPNEKYREIERRCCSVNLYYSMIVIEGGSIGRIEDHS